MTINERTLAIAQAKRQATKRGGWTEEEDRLLMESGLPTWKLALKFARTNGSCVTRKAKLTDEKRFADYRRENDL